MPHSNSNSEAGSHKEEITEAVARQAKVVRKKAVEAVERGKGGVSEELERLADKLEDIETDPKGPHELDPVVDYAARTVRRAAGALEHRSAEQLVELVKSKVRERPGLAIAAIFALGFLGGRLLRK